MAYLHAQRWDSIVVSQEWIEYTGAGRTGLTFNVAIQRNSDDKWLDFTNGWQVSYTDGVMLEPDSSNIPGYYERAIPSEFLSQNESFYRVKVTAAIQSVYDPELIIPYLLYHTISVIP